MIVSTAELGLDKAALAKTNDMVNLFPCLTKHYAMKAYVGVGV
jgi:hypothetical protein